MERDLSIGEAIDYGIGFAMHGNHRSACELFRGVLIHEPENVEVLNHLGVSLFELHTEDPGSIFEAFFCFDRALKLDRRHRLALANYGLCLSQLGYHEEALPYLERAVMLTEKADIAPKAKAMAYNNFGNLLERLNRHADALPILEKGVAYDPDDPFPHYNRGICLLRLNRHAEGILSMDRAMGLHSPIAREGTGSRLNIADTLYNRAMGHLLLGNFKAGFADYENRLMTSEVTNYVIPGGPRPKPNLGLPVELKWEPGASIEGKTLLVHAEQGLGDTLQFIRFLPQLVPMCREVLLVAHREVRRLIDIPGVRVLEPGSGILGRDKEWVPAAADSVEPQRYDCWVALMSLPLYLGIEREDQIPAPVAPKVDCERFFRWREEIGQRNQLTVGICWSGSFQHKNDAHRSIPLAKFATLFDAPADFISLQQMRPGETHEFAELKEKHPNLSALYFEDFRDTAAAMRSIDLIISVDTAVAHLAGTLFMPTWTLIPKMSTDWRWMLDRTDTPWYPTMTLVRQDKIGDWKTTLDRVKGDLTRMAAQDRAA